MALTVREMWPGRVVRVAALDRYEDEEVKIGYVGAVIAGETWTIRPYVHAHLTHPTKQWACVHGQYEAATPEEEALWRLGGAP